MTAPALSAAASGLLKAIIGRSGAGRDQILLSDVRSVDWHSLTFDGERHRFALRIIGPNAEAYTTRLSHRLADAEFSIPGILVADITISEGPDALSDGSVALTIEALTVDAH